jgi:phosphoglycolate phosphatase
MKYKIVIFDLDGTILNTLEDLADSTNYALSVFDMPERTIEEIRHFVGNGIRKLMERAVPQGTPESMIVKVHETFTEHYKKHCADKTRPYDGIKYFSASAFPIWSPIHPHCLAIVIIIYTSFLRTLFCA